MNHRLRAPFRLRFAELPSWRQAFLLFVGAAFLLQSFVTQTHIHPLPQLSTAKRLVSLDPDVSVKADKANRTAPSRDRLPANDDPAKCPLCQAVGHAGNYVWPQTAVFVLPQLAAAIVPVTLVGLQTPERQSHDWQGRAPPRL